MSAEALYAHLSTGCTTVCHLWKVARADGVVMGFTDHDGGIELDGVSYRADTGLTAQALQKTTGLSVDNTEAVGALSSFAIDEADIAAGRYDGAEVKAWLVNWQDLSQRVCLFRGHFGEITYGDGMFKVELRGLTDRLNQPQGRTFQKTCGAVLGDGKCGVDLSLPQFSHEETVTVALTNEIVLSGAGAFAAGWFDFGTVTALSGAAEGLKCVVKADVAEGGARRLILWDGFRVPLQPGDRVRVTAGCDRLMGTCQAKFDNLLNFRGFPHIPGDDWLASYPVSSNQNTGGSLVGAGSGQV
jgi:uncharacterized phage protein (TIGR02218 family)